MIGHIMSIKKGFDKVAKDYDQDRKKLIPCFDDLYGTAIKIVPYSKTDKIKVIDLGAGTGLFTSKVAEVYPDWEYTLIDISEKMLDEAKKRFSNNSVNYIVQDYINEPIDSEYDLIISALSIHHLSDQQKKELFKKLFLNLKKGGIFINADQVLGENKTIDSLYRSEWLDEVKRKGVTKEVLSSAIERMKEDKMSTLSNQLRWLKEAGFTNVNCWYKNLSFVVYSGRK